MHWCCLQLGNMQAILSHTFVFCKLYGCHGKLQHYLLNNLVYAIFFIYLKNHLAWGNNQLKLYSQPNACFHFQSVLLPHLIQGLSNSAKSGH